jgi:amidohydrolase
MAAQDEFEATVLGRGGHGALPHAARDPLLAASLGVVAIQNVVARFVDPVRPAVVTVGSLHAGSAPNVIPDEARLRGTMRSFDDATRDVLRERVREALAGAAHACGCETRFQLKPGYPAVVNDPASAAHVAEIADRLFGADNVVECPPVAAAEDFAYFLREVPGAFAFLGAGNVERGITAPHHSPSFDIDESVLPLGARLLAEIALGAPRG